MPQKFFCTVNRPIISTCFHVEYLWVFCVVKSRDLIKTSGAVVRIQVVLVAAAICLCGSYMLFAGRVRDETG